MTDAPAPRIRLDKWLWQARFFKSRSLASKVVSEGRVRINSDRTDKPAAQVVPGDVLTFPQGKAVRVVRILAVGTRRGPAPEARALYDDLTPPAAAAPAPAGPRPTKRDRRALDDLRDRDPEG
ncbi:RNA-binding S4 domain-containing protein [Rhodobacterales bacterium HKCCE2091]|nr:RNA-binding S4 domain-containing protein [Rhodobacterales bacterium HKCCE2091]